MAGKELGYPKAGPRIEPTSPEELAKQPRRKLTMAELQERERKHKGPHNKVMGPPREPKPYEDAIAPAPEADVPPTPTPEPGA
ncbi:hypothetical protein [Streptomyces purpureus]|uniref:Uncharacterized protein n=1 Tax=Streptomyces purpureus TaxID=1951 RepID=A0A918HHQ8_9ACTN|nr:hypothetical protein [Streptomyces purpureus]GGT62932.1 hypothetical protein GCM10014713_65270 [Streptomyces purpureus]